MKLWLIAAVTAAYIWTTLDYLRIGNLPSALIWGGYSIANLGFIWAMRTHAPM